MPTLPKRMIPVLRQFETVMSERVWEWAKVLLIGAILAKGRAHGGCNLAGDGMLAGETVPELSPGAESRGLVEPRTEPPPAGVEGRACLCQQTSQ